MATTGKRKGKGKGKKAVRRKKTVPQISKKQILIGLGLLLAIVFVAYSPVLTASFVDIDDNKLVLEKGREFGWSPKYFLKREFGKPYYKPVTYLSWRAEYRAVGPEPFLYHFNNLLLHLMNCLLVFFIIRRLAPYFKTLKGKEVQIAFFSALLFGLHPMHVESVAWIVERKDVLYTFFFLIGLAGYIQYVEKQKLWPLAVSVIAYLLSTLSKAPGITMLAVLFLIDIAMQRKLNARLFYEKAGYVAVFIFALYAFGVFTRSSGEGSFAALVNSDKQLAKAENVAEAPSGWGKATLAGMRATLWYLHSWLPFRTSLGYPREAIIGFFGFFINIFPILIAAGAALVIRYRKRFPLLFFAHAFFFITLSPSIARLGLGIGIFMSDRYVYLPVLGLIFLMVAWLITLKEKGWVTQKVKFGMLIGIALIMAIMSFNGARTWQNAETLWTNVINKYPNVDYAYVNRGSYYRQAGDLQKALDDINKAISYNDNANARIQRGLIYRQLGQPQQAITDYTRAIELDSKDNQAYINRGNAYLDARQFQLALADYNEALKREPRNARSLVNRAIAFATLKDYNSALADFNAAEKFERNYKEIYVNRAILYFETGRYREALADYTRHLKFEPNDHQIYNDMAVVHQVLNEHTQAIEKLTQAISIQPAAPYFTARARSYDALGRTAEAQRDRQSAGG